MPVVGSFFAFVTFVNLWQSWQNSVAIAFPSPSGNSTTGFGGDGEAGVTVSCPLSWGVAPFCARIFEGMAKAAKPRINARDIMMDARREKMRFDKYTIASPPNIPGRGENHLPISRAALYRNKSFKFQ